MVFLSNERRTIILADLICEWYHSSSIHIFLQFVFFMILNCQNDCVKVVLPFDKDSIAEFRRRLFALFW